MNKNLPENISWFRLPEYVKNLWNRVTSLENNQSTSGDGFNPEIAFGEFAMTSNGIVPSGANAILDFSGFGNASKLKRFYPGVIQGVIFNSISNADLLTNLEDLGTQQALQLVNYGLTDIIIDNLFTQLPTTTSTVTINVSGNPGSATCNPTIATNKGYTVITS